MVDVCTFTSHWVLLIETNITNYSQPSWAPLILVLVALKQLLLGYTTRTARKLNLTDRQKSECGMAQIYNPSCFNLGMSAQGTQNNFS